ncbi:MAG: hypothetical protein IT361_04175 [Gemmatimonadaceae bacterium]|nr:hypothetical protein [Gemmatimonadaceae bacterium]
MSMRRVSLVLFSLAAACSSSGGAGGTASASAAAPARRGNANLISEAEVQAILGQATNAYDIVERLRPQMLRPRGTSMGARSDGTGAAVQIGIVVYMDDVRVGEVGNLRTVLATQVREIRFISATDATQRWGTGHGSGAIQVVSKR